MMKPAKTLAIFLLIIQAGILWAKSPKDPEINLADTPPRIIRTCCALGADMQLFGIPFVKFNQITSMDKLGAHTYLGGKSEGNGLIHTLNGGFIDIAHLRDQADWTKYLYYLILHNKEKGELVKKLGYEGGTKTLTVKIDKNLDSLNCLLLAGKIAYDLSLWHELSTWFGASAVPMMPERYSSFSVEDAYSNLLGVLIGIEALKSNLPYDEAMTELINQKLESLGADQSEEETYAALEAVRDIWWTRNKRLPNGKVLIERDTDVFTHIHPWIVPALQKETPKPLVLDVPLSTIDGKPLTNLYQFSIELNYKFPFKELFPDRETQQITQNDFETLLTRVAHDLGKYPYASYSKSESDSAEDNKNYF